uniref:Uncharacterized protein n=1 Tax=Opuntia streptacantha TaxID=393608 RepID=A0A7C9DWU1_OPUST
MNSKTNKKFVETNNPVYSSIQQPNHCQTGLYILKLTLQQSATLSSTCIHNPLLFAMHQPKETRRDHTIMISSNKITTPNLGRSKTQLSSKITNNSSTSYITYCN